MDVRFAGHRKLIQLRSVFDVNAFRLRSLAATVLSLWLGILACVLGCAQPMSASTLSTHIRISELKTIGNEDTKGEMADAASCFHHSRGASEKNKQNAQTVSCCPLDATLIQKQDPVSPLQTDSHVILLMLLAFRPALPLSAMNRTSAPTTGHAGRDVLLQIHVLRI